MAFDEFCDVEILLDVEYARKGVLKLCPMLIFSGYSLAQAVPWSDR